jgi:Cu(I)/Ag(I) efflux system membrane fusion protein
MNRMTLLIGTGLLVAAALGAGYWWGTRTASHAPAAQDAAPTASAPPSGAPNIPGRILYYRHPMGLPDTSPVPKKDSMGMDYVPVYEGEVPQGPGFVIPADKLQRLGVRTTEAGPRRLARSVRAVGTVEVDERREAAVSPKFEGYVTRLYVATTGAPVRRGEPLLDVYSPELVSAQEEYLVARRNLDAQAGAGAELRARLERLVAASRMRLENWDIDPHDIAAIERGRSQKTVLVRSPVDGVVLEKRAVVGQRFVAGETLYKVASLDRVWLVANVFEQDLSSLAPGRPARATFAAYPGETFAGTLAFIYPTLESETRTLAVRVELPNPSQRLKPGLYGTVEIAAPAVDAAVAVPESAVLDSGTRRLVFAAYNGGRFEAREVELGARADGYVAVERGLDAGQAIVVDGNFLIDAESNLRAGAGAFGHAHGGTSKNGDGAVAPPSGGDGAAGATPTAAAGAGANTPEAHAGHSGN